MGPISALEPNLHIAGKHHRFNLFKEPHTHNAWSKALQASMAERLETNAHGVRHGSAVCSRSGVHRARTVRRRYIKFGYGLWRAHNE
jgi:hypothetical protein